MAFSTETTVAQGAARIREAIGRASEVADQVTSELRDIAARYGTQPLADFFGPEDTAILIDLYNKLEAFRAAETGLSEVPLL